MLRHNLLLIYRSFKRHKSSLFINLIGLSSGLTCTLLIYLWVSDELKVDKFHEADSRLFQVMINRQNSDDIITQEHGPGLLADALMEEIPEVKYAASYTHSFLKSKKTLSVGEIHVKCVGDYVGNDFLKMFSFELIHGDKNQALSDKSSIVISKDLAHKLFGSAENVIGKSVEWEHQKSFQISGVLENIASNSSIKFDYLLPYNVYADDNKWMLAWDNNAPGTYVVLKDGADVSVFNTKIKNLVKNKDKDSNVTLFARKFSEGYLYSDYKNGQLVGGRIAYVRLFSIVAIFILFIACINFMNLSTAKASRRIKELGIKKAIGANRGSLIYQFLGESMLMTLISLILALVIVGLFLPQFNQITGKQISFGLNPELIWTLLGVTIFTGLVSGSYPALYLSGFKPAIVLKGKLSRSIGELWVRKGLVIFQFTLSVILIVSVLVVYKQIEFIQSKNLGFDKDNVITFEREGWAKTNLEDFLAKIKTLHGVVNASSMMENFIDGKTSTYEISWDGKNPEDVIDFQFRVVGFDLSETLMIEVAEGRTFGKEFGSEDSTVIFNETAIKVMGLKDAIGKVIRLWGKNRQIVGVTKDFQFASLYEEVKPLLFILDREATNSIMVRIQAGKEAEAIESLNAFYKQFNPGFVLDFKFLDQDFQALYQAEQRVGILSQYFAGIAMVISCLGLFGLVAFTAEKRLKEIGIRKILGSSNLNIVGLLSFDFTKMVLTAIIIALPVSYLIARNWLDSFEYRIDLEWWFFIGAGLLALFITWSIVGLQTINASRVSPLDCVKDE